MLVQSISANTSFGGLKQIEAIGKRYAKSPQDSLLVDSAKKAAGVELDITSDGIFLEGQDAVIMDTFISDAKKSDNGKLAFLLANDIRQSFSCFDKISDKTTKAMIEIARNSKGVTKKDVLNYLV